MKVEEKFTGKIVTQADIEKLLKNHPEEKKENPVKGTTQFGQHTLTQADIEKILKKDK